MSRERLTSIQRVLRVRETMRRQEEWKLAACEREVAALRDAQQRLFDFLDASDLGAGPLLETMARNARSLSPRIAAAEGARAEQACRLLEEERKTKLAERRQEELAAYVRRDDEKRDLAEWIERVAASAERR